TLLLTTSHDFLTAMPLPIIFITDTPTTAIYTLSLHDALPISLFSIKGAWQQGLTSQSLFSSKPRSDLIKTNPANARMRITKPARSEEHTSELQSRENLVCRLLLEKKKIQQIILI